MKEFIMLPIMGALIGYSTNWLAIKMIFRPYEEKRFLGMRVPFTPGVMAKERFALSKKFGDSIAENVITDEEILKHIANIDFNKIVKNAIKNIDADTTLSAFIEKDESKDSLVNILKIVLERVLTNEEIENISEQITLSIKENFLNEQNLGKIFTKEEKIEFIQGLKNNESVSSLFSDTIYNLLGSEEEKQLVEIFGQDVFDKITESVEKNGNSLRIAIKNYIDSESFDYIQEIVENVIKNAIGKIPMLAMFGGEGLVKMVSPHIFTTLNDYFSEEENNLSISDFFNHLVDYLAKSTVNGVTEVIDEEIINSFGEIIIDSICNSLVKDIENDNTNSDFTSSIIMDNLDLIENKLKTIIGGFIKDLANDEHKINNILKTVVDKVLNIKVGSLMGNLGEYEVDKIGEFVKNTVNQNIGVMLKEIDFSKIIEEKINTFEMEEAERLVIEVMNKELKMITYLGGVLGAIVGTIGIFV